MSEILSALLFREPVAPEFREPLEGRCSPVEEELLVSLGKLDPAAAWDIQDHVRMVTRERYEEGFLSGIRFGARLMEELMERPERETL